LTADSSGNFSGNITTSTVLGASPPDCTATATSPAGATYPNNTSEFAANYLYGYFITGTVFEDVNYAGGGGRALASATGYRTPAGATPATVELYDGSGTYLRNTTTDASGAYSFAALAASTSYHVRVVSSTVRSARAGSTSALVGVLTFRTDGSGDPRLRWPTTWAGPTRRWWTRGRPAAGPSSTRRPSSIRPA
jgi:hypothetical protein